MLSSSTYFFVYPSSNYSLEAKHPLRCIYAQGVKKACENLRARLDSTREKLSKEGKGDVSWAELVKICKSSDVDLSERIW